MSPSSQKTNLSLFLPWLAFVLFIFIIGVLVASAPGALTFLLNSAPFGSGASTLVPTSIGHPTVAAIATAPPGISSSTLDQSKKAFGTFIDDFSNPNSGWTMESNPSYSVGYTKDQSYAITLMVPNRTIFETPPETLTLPFKNASVKVGIKQGDYPGSSYGVMCDFQNGSNFYAVEIKDRQYRVVKMVFGQQLAITSPEWKNASNIEYADDMGYVQLTVNCSGSSIGIQINGATQPVIVDPTNTYQSGNVAIFALSGAAAKAGLYDQVFFDNFKLTVNP